MVLSTCVLQNGMMKRIFRFMESIKSFNRFISGPLLAFALKKAESIARELFRGKKSQRKPCRGLCGGMKGEKRIGSNQWP